MRTAALGSRTKLLEGRSIAAAAATAAGMKHAFRMEIRIIAAASSLQLLSLARPLLFINQPDGSACEPYEVAARRVVRAFIQREAAARQHPALTQHVPRVDDSLIIGSVAGQDVEIEDCFKCSHLVIVREELPAPDGVVRVVVE